MAFWFEDNRNNVVAYRWVPNNGRSPEGYQRIEFSFGDASRVAYASQWDEHYKMFLFHEWLEWDAARQLILASGGHLGDLEAYINRDVEQYRAARYYEMLRISK
jgi:hypothetical protein